jgi:hypothetical protein
MRRTFRRLGAGDDLVPAGEPEHGRDGDRHCPLVWAHQDTNPERITVRSNFDGLASANLGS